MCVFHLAKIDQAEGPETFLTLLGLIQSLSSGKNTLSWFYKDHRIFKSDVRLVS